MTAPLISRPPAPNAPALAAISVILGLPDDDAEGVLAVIESLRVQSIADQLEVLIVASQSALARLSGCSSTGFFAVRVVPVDVIHGWADAMARGIEEASAEIVVLAEDHAFPAPGWAEAILAGYVSGCAAVAPVIENANPRTGLSWTHILLDYGRWLAGNESGERDELPGHNGSYRRSVLRDIDPQLLLDLLSPRGGLNTELRKQGHRLFLQGSSVVRHQHPSRLGASIAMRYLAGRRLGASRASQAGWSQPRRIIYALCAPILYVMRWRYVLESVRLSSRKDVLPPRVIGMLSFCLIFGVIGEMIGYLFDAGNTPEYLSDIEFHRLSKMIAADQEDARRETADLLEALSRAPSTLAT